jgi:hypothetical protein
MRSIIPINFYKVEYINSILTYYREGRHDCSYSKNYINKYRSKILTHTIYQNTEYRNRAGRYSYV